MKIKDITTAEYEGFELWVELGRPTNWIEYTNDNGKLYRFIEANRQVIEKRVFEL